MDFMNELHDAVNRNIDEFKLIIQQKVAENPNILNHIFWVSETTQMTVLDFLIQEHLSHRASEDGERVLNLTEHIDYVLRQSKDCNLNDPLHRALDQGKDDLVCHLLQNNEEDHAFDLNQRDVLGRTLLHLVLKTKKVDLLQILIARMVKINVPTRDEVDNLPYQPLYQAVALDFADGVRLLMNNGAQAHYLSALQETPVLLAARLGKIQALEALLELPHNHLTLETENIKNGVAGNTAIVELALRVQEKNEVKGALRGIAMLLCCGAELPRSKELCQLLRANRKQLLGMIDVYLQNKPDLVYAFVNRCHQKKSELHRLIYADNSWASWFRHLFGKPSDAAFTVEGFVTRKNSNPLVPQGQQAIAIPAVRMCNENQDPIELFAEFVRRYSEAYKNQRITNPWSTMRWRIAGGTASWEQVVHYAEKYPRTRTGIIYRNMLASVNAADIHAQIDADSDSESSLQPS